MQKKKKKPHTNKQIKTKQMQISFPELCLVYFGILTFGQFSFTTFDWLKSTHICSLSNIIIHCKGNTAKEKNSK